MYAVVVTGGKQYRVMQGETLRVELLEAEAGSEIKFDNVLMLGDGEGVTHLGRHGPLLRRQVVLRPHRTKLGPRSRAMRFRSARMRSSHRSHSV